MKKYLVLVLFCVLVLGVIFPAQQVLAGGKHPTPTPIAEGDIHHKSWICHFTSSEKNPVVLIPPDDHSWDAHSGHHGDKYLKDYTDPHDRPDEGECGAPKATKTPKATTEPPVETEVPPTEVIPTKKVTETEVPKPTSTLVPTEEATDTPMPTEGQPTPTPYKTKTVRPTDPQPTGTTAPTSTLASPTATPTPILIDPPRFTETPLPSETFPPSPTPKARDKKVEKGQPSAKAASNCLSSELLVATVRTNNLELDVTIVHPDGSYNVLTKELPGDSFSAEVSPNGCLIAFVNIPAPDDKGDIWVMGVDGSNPVNITNSPDKDDTAPSFISNYMVGFSSDGELWKITANGKHLSMLEVSAQEVAALPFSGLALYKENASSPGIVSVWGAQYGLEIFDELPITKISFCPDGKYAFGIYQGKVAMFNLQTREFLVTETIADDVDLRTDGKKAVLEVDGHLYTVLPNWKTEPTHLAGSDEVTFSDPDWWSPEKALRVYFYKFPQK